MSEIKKELAGTTLKKFIYRVEAGKIMEFAGAIYDSNPVYRNLEYARESGFDHFPMPVTFPINNLLQIDAENVVTDIMDELNMDPNRSIHGSCEFIYEKGITAGEEFTAELRIGNVYEKTGKRGGVMTFVEMETLFYDKGDHLAFTIRNTFIERDQI